MHGIMPSFGLRPRPSGQGGLGRRHGTRDAHRAHGHIGPAADRSAPGLVAWAPVDCQRCVEQYLIGGEGVGRRGDGEVAERARPDGVQRNRRGCDGRQRWRHCPVAQWSEGGGEWRPKMEGHRVVVALTR
jgi:hypothetical protein